jgi:hypothetical protein
MVRPAIALLALLALLAAAAFGSRPRIVIRDPYAGGGTPFRGQLHAHSTTHKYWVHADSLRDKVERYRDAGFDFVCITDHNFVTAFQDSPYAVLPTRDPGVDGIRFISGAEIGFSLAEAPGRKHHIGGVGMDWSVERGESLFAVAETDTLDAQAAIDSIRTLRYAESSEALAILNHPEMEARHEVRFYPRDLAVLRGQAGIEVFNTKWSRARPGGKSWQNHGASHWDYVIAKLDGMRWGFATDDAHEYVTGSDFLGGWITVWAAEPETGPLLDAVKAGRFVACVDSCEGAVCDTASAVFTELGARDGAIVAASDRPTEFTWWTDYGHLARRVERALADTFAAEGWERAVRVRIRNDAGAAYSQPFWVESPERDEDRWQLRPEKRTELLYHFNEGAGPVAEDASGHGRHLLLETHPPPPPESWPTLADTAAYRDSLWGGWLHNGTGTVPDETDVDRDRWGYALRAHGRTLRAEVGAAVPAGDAMTLEWIGAVTRRTDEEQPIFVRESMDAGGRRRGWRIVAAEAHAAEVYRFRFYTDDDEGRAVTVPITSVRPGEVHLVAVAREGKRGAQVRVHVDGRIVHLGDASGPAPARLVADEPFVFFADPFRPDAEAFFRLRELRLTSRARSPDAIREDAERLEFLPPGTAP